MDIHLQQTSTQAEMEATLRALHRDADSARRMLRRPRRTRRSAAGAPRLWDASAVDSRPDDCWRCDAAVSADALGLCPACRADLI
ncbi:MAG TPA: hypothetical protein VGR26_10230 [Acidimicrobiales bacterium]|nr:hypothetical protein [Acidimicrobiales bacterium]